MLFRLKTQTIICISSLLISYTLASASDHLNSINYQFTETSNTQQFLNKLLNSNYFTKNWKNLIFTLFALSIPTTLLFFKPNILHTIMDNMFNGNGAASSAADFLNRRKNRFMNKKINPKHQKVMKKGGNIGGLINDGNTCFMNSVLQSLASSNSLIKFLEEETLEESNCKDLKFTKSFKTLLDNLNAKHFNKGRDYKTNSMLKTMTKSPNKNILLGYNQEDAQEFFQSLLSELESDYKKIHPSNSTTNKTEPILTSTLPDNAVHGIENLGYIGPVYIPSCQIDPNLKDSTLKSSQFNLLTPVDGLSAERIGCLQCGEMGGIRYSVISGLSLNLPPDNYDALKLSDLLTKWIEPEIIEGVDCNRCALNSVLEYQQNQLNLLNNKESSSSTEKLVNLLKIRIQEIERELQKPIIDDEISKKFYTKNMMKKCSKSKQILISRPPPLLAIHINRSVFDPMTYRVRKNNARVVFPSKLDLDPYVAEPNDINTDARLPLSKKVKVQEPIIDDEESDVDTPESLEKIESPKSIKKDQELLNSSEDEDENSDEDSDYEGSNPTKSNGTTIVKEDEPTGPLVYALRSVIVHYGTHNYGHYIAYRKYRGVWWRTSDETIDIVEEDEVLNVPGVFMLFYELDTLSDDNNKDISEDEESENNSDDELTNGVKISGESDQDGDDEQNDDEKEEEEESKEDEESMANTIANL